MATMRQKLVDLEAELQKQINIFHRDNPELMVTDVELDQHHSLGQIPSYATVSVTVKVRR